MKNFSRQKVGHKPGQGFVSRTGQNSRQSYKVQPNAVKSPKKSSVIDDTKIKILSDGAKFISGWSMVTILFCMVIAGNIVDVAAGGLSLSLSMTRDIPFAGWLIPRELIAWSISIFISGVQVLLLIYWKTQQKSMGLGNRAILFGILILDTMFDLALPGYLVYGTSPLDFTWVGHTPYFYALMLLVGLACAFAELATIAVAELSPRRMR